MESIPLTSIEAVTPFVLPCVHSALAQWHWDCPGCGWHLVAYWTEQATPETIAADPLCTLCRQDPGRQAPGSSRWEGQGQGQS